ncbi:MAG: hypothetical protein QXF61_07160 [Nitrososphaeria archaeon]
MPPAINISPEPNPGYVEVMLMEYCSNAIHHMKNANIANVAGNKASFLFLRRRASEPKKIHRKTHQIVILASIEA